MTTSISPAANEQLVRNGTLLVNLYERYAPTAPAPRPDWEVFSLACLARARYTLATILEVRHRELDAVALTRSLYEHVVAFAWLAIEPERHFPMFLAWERRQRVKINNELKEYGVVALSNDDVKRATLEAGDVSAPETADRALHADKFWARARPDWSWSFRRTYANLFRAYSAFIHPTVMGLDPFVTRTPTGPAVAHDKPTEVELEVLPSAVALFADGLAVASHRLGWPPSSDLLLVFTHGIGAQVR